MAVILNFVVSWCEVCDREICGAWAGCRQRVSGLAGSGWRVAGGGWLGSHHINGYFFMPARQEKLICKVQTLPEGLLAV